MTWILIHRKVLSKHRELSVVYHMMCVVYGQHSLHIFQCMPCDLTVEIRDFSCVAHHRTNIYLTVPVCDATSWSRIGWYNYQSGGMWLDHICVWIRRCFEMAVRQFEFFKVFSYFERFSTIKEKFNGIISIILPKCCENWYTTPFACVLFSCSSKLVTLTCKMVCLFICFSCLFHVYFCSSACTCSYGTGLHNLHHFATFRTSILCYTKKNFSTV